jgi:hypothetical protein
LRSWFKRFQAILITCLKSRSSIIRPPLHPLYFLGTRLQLLRICLRRRWPGCSMICN